MFRRVEYGALARRSHYYVPCRSGLGVDRMVESVEGMSRTTPAQNLSRAVTQLLTLKGWFVFRVGSTAGRNSKGDWYRTGTVGAPDLVCVKGKSYMLLELKAGKDVQSDAQKSFEIKVLAVDGHYEIIRSIDDVLTTLGEPSKEVGR